MDIFWLDFMQRAWLAGFFMAVLCPVIGCFLVLRHQSMIGDGLGHIAFAGVAGGALLGFQPVLSAAAARVFCGEKMTKKGLCGMIIGLCGIMLAALR